MKIIKIVPQKFKKEYVTVFLEGEPHFKLHQEVAVQHHLEENMEIDPISLAQIRNENERKEALEYALLFLSYRARSEREMKERLRKKGFSPEVVTETMEELKKRKLIDDELFAKNLAESRARHKLYGAIRIQQELAQKGVDRDISEKAVRELQSPLSPPLIKGERGGFEIPSEEERAAQLLEKRIGQIRHLDSHTAYRRLQNFLLRRGFSYDVVEKAMNRFLKS